MLEIEISMESTCDLPQELLQKYNLSVIDMDFVVGDDLFNTAKDNVISSKLYERMVKGERTTTSQINETNYEEYFAKLLKNGKDIIHIGFSSGLSGTVNVAKRVADKLNLTCKNKIYVLDSLCACSGQGILGICARNFCEKAKNVEDLINYIENIKLKLNHCFSVNSLKYLANGGRIKHSTAIIGNILNIKPIMQMDSNGCLKSVEKVISRKKALITLANTYVEKRLDSCTQCFVSHANCLEDAQFICDFVTKKTGIQPIITNLGAVIGSHSGPGTIAIYFFSNSR